MTDENAPQQEYKRIIESQTTIWQGSEISLAGLGAVPEEPDRRTRERAWRLGAERALQDREGIGDLWGRLVLVRHQKAIDAGFPDYRAYRRLRGIDASPKDYLRLHHVIEEWVTPVAVRLHEERRIQLGLRRFQPWDLQAGTSSIHRVVFRLLTGAMADAFEHWTYTHVEEVADLTACGRQWRSCWLRFLPSVDWSGLDEELEAEWHRHTTLFLAPFTSIELALEQLAEVLGHAIGPCPDEHTIREAMEDLQEATDRQKLPETPEQV